MNKNNTADADILERAREFVDNENPFVKGRPEIVMRRHWLLEFMIGFAQSEIARAGKSDGDIRDEILEQITVIDFAPYESLWLEKDGTYSAMRRLPNQEAPESQVFFKSIEEAYRWIMEANK